MPDRILDGGLGTRCGGLADELGGIYPEGLHQPADRAPLGFRHVAGEGKSYMGRFPRTVGKRFSRLDERLVAGPSAPPPAQAGEREEVKCPGRNIQDLAFLSGTTTSGVDLYAFHRAVKARARLRGLRHAASWMWTSENSPSTHSGE
jgi:hypothetical protein